MSSPGMVVCAEPLAVEVGNEVLERGGNAMDAALAASLAQGVVNPLMCSLGGKGVMVVYQAASGEMSNIRFWGEAGSKALPTVFESDYLGQDGAVTGYRVRDERNSVGYESIMTPGYLLGIHTAWRRYGSGTLSWSDLMIPAIELASDGFLVYPRVYNSWDPANAQNIFRGARLLRTHPEAERIFTQGGRVYEVGQRLRQPDYARTLTRVAEDGPAVFYTGEIGATIVADMEQNGGLFTEEDLANHQVLVGEPVVGTYRDFQVITDRPPGCGALLVQLLNIVEGWDLEALGWNTPQYLDKLARTMNLVFKDRARYMGDPRFVHVPVEDLISKDRSAAVRSRIDSGDDPEETSLRRVGSEGTTHLSVIDGQGNAVSMTHTLGLCSGVVTPGLGFLYNNDMVAFDPLPGHRNSIAPGKMPINGGSPTILLKDGQVAMAIGSPAGARKLTAELQAILNVVDFGMGMQEAVSAPRIHSEDEQRVIVVEPSFPTDLADQLEEIGHEVRIDPYTACLSAVWRDPVTGELEGGADPRGGGTG